MILAKKKPQRYAFLYFLSYIMYNKRNNSFAWVFFRCFTFTLILILVQFAVENFILFFFTKKYTYTIFYLMVYFKQYNNICISIARKLHYMCKCSVYCTLIPYYWCTVKKKQHIRSVFTLARVFFFSYQTIFI